MMQKKTKKKKKNTNPRSTSPRDQYDLIIIGGGVTGFAGAMYAGRLNLKTLIFAELPGGIITTTDIVENYPGFKQLTGQELADKIREHALEYDITFIQERVND